MIQALFGMVVFWIGGAFSLAAFNVAMGVPLLRVWKTVLLWPFFATIALHRGVPTVKSLAAAQLDTLQKTDGEQVGIKMPYPAEHSINPYALFEHVRPDLQADDHRWFAFYDYQLPSKDLIVILTSLRCMCCGHSLEDAPARCPCPEKIPLVFNRCSPTFVANCGEGDDPNSLPVGDWEVIENRSITQEDFERMATKDSDDV